VKKNYFTATVTFDSQTPKSHQFTSRMDQYWIGLDWIEQCFMSSPTQYRLYRRRFLQVKKPNQQLSKYWRRKLQRKKPKRMDQSIIFCF